MKSDKDKSRFKKKYGDWAVITGASSGIGLAIAEELAKIGLNLIINSRSETRLQEIATHFSNNYKIETVVVTADLSTTEGIEKVISSSKGKEVGLFIPSAGFGTSGYFTNSILEQEVNMLSVNVEAVLKLTHHFSKRFVKQGRGGIIFLSSIVAFQGVPYASNYASTKAYIQSFAEALTVELKPYGVDVLSAAPAAVESGFGNRANMKMANSMRPQDISTEIINALGRKSNVLPGSLTKVLTYLLKTVPRWAKVKIMKQVMGGFTRHQRFA
ncbi:MAG: SDR family NAD(P)-dependent oxidoreductase [Bacteroidota bacterium]